MKFKDIILEDSSYLKKLVNQDQLERNEYNTFVKTQVSGDYDRGAQEYAKKKGRDKNDIFGEKPRYNEFITNANKFPYDKFSKEDWKNYWLIAQHIDFNRKFQQSALMKIKQYLGADSEEYQYLYDRIKCGLTGNQKYNTQDRCEKD